MTDQKDGEISFHTGVEGQCEVMRLTAAGMYYKGVFVDDAGAAQQAMIETLRELKAARQKSDQAPADAAAPIEPSATESGTPRIDEFIKQLPDGIDRTIAANNFLSLCTYAEKLETELTAARRENESLKGKLQFELKANVGMFNELAALRKQLEMQVLVSDCLGRQVTDKDKDRIFFRDALKVAEDTIAKRDAEIAQLLKYAKHGTPEKMCNHMRHSGFKCDCGFDELLAARKDSTTFINPLAHEQTK